ncbi:glycosyltransferase family 4 protein [Telmatocola sphagniphila]|uniref:Glycosyltransferase family 4 protein n=1 Tax=Telmatocola sphagniphila TaxID=1123043 RepID=A0A8E6EZK5_9BACT|nr:glycosyltransferase family 4 protein [Telmatocola sphagniphila]QVL33566.1 glycosyltransferase family 4 protein [Telmatocola sphagniphila]
MKILIISNLYPPDFLGGYELGCRQVVDALRTAGHEVMVLTGTPRRVIPNHRDEPHVTRRLKLEDLYDDYSQRTMHPVMQSIQNLEANCISSFNVQILCEHLEKFEPDVAYLWNLIGLGGLGLIAALQHAGTPWVMHLMDMVPVKLCEIFRDRAVNGIQESFLKLCQGQFISCSQSTLHELAHYGLPVSERSILIPNWVEFFDELPREYCPEGKLRVVCAGTLSEAKGTKILIEAAFKLKNRGYSNFSIDLFGHCPDPQFESLILSFGLCDQVKYRGVKSQASLIESYTNYDLFAFPTHEREPFGFAPMEAAARGCVPLVSELCGFSEWFVHAVDCVKVHRSSEAWADALQRVLDDFSPYQRIGIRAAKIIKRDFCLPSILPRIVQVLKHAQFMNTTRKRSLEDACRMAILAERTFRSLLQELAA